MREPIPATWLTGGPAAVHCGIMCWRGVATGGGEMSANPKSSGDLRAVFWALTTIIAVGLALMIVLPLAGR